MGKKRQRVRWNTVEGLKWSGKEGREEQNEDSRIPAPDSESPVVDVQQQQPEQLLSTDDNNEQNGYNNNRRQKPVFNGPKQYYNNYGRGEYNYNNYYNHHNGGMNGGGNWGLGYNNGGWVANDQSLGPRFERRGQGKGRYQLQDSEGSFDTEEMPNGFTKIRSKNLDILFKREYYQHKLRPKEKNENGVECGVAVCQGYGCPGGCTNGCQQVCPAILTTVPISVTEGESQQIDIATTDENTTTDASENTADSDKLQVPAKSCSTGRGSFEHINVSEIAEFKPSSMTTVSLNNTPECTADATFYPPPYYQTAAVDPTVSSAATAVNYQTVNVSNSDKSPAQATTIPVMSTANYMAPPTAVSATDSTAVRPNLYLYSPADNTLIPCKGVFLTDQGSYYYMASPAPPTGPISAGGSSTGSNGSCTPMPVPPPHHIGYMAAPAATYPHTVLEGYSDSGSVPYYSSPCMSQCQSSTPQTPNSSGTSTQPASPPLLQSYHPTNWFPSESKIEIEEEPSQQPQANQNDTPTVQYIPGLPADLTTTKKKKKKKKKVVAEKVLEHRDSLSSDQEQLLLSTLRPQGGVQSGDESNIVATPPLEQPVVEVVLTDDLADSMVNPPTDPECSDEETLKSTTNNNNNLVESDTDALVRDDTFTNLNEIQDCEQAANNNNSPTKNDIHEGSGSETNEHLTDSGIEDNVCNTSSENIQEESEDSKEDDVIADEEPGTVEAIASATSYEITAPEHIITTETESEQIKSDSVENIELEKLEEKEEKKEKDLMAVKETEGLTSNTCNNTADDKITDSKIETEVRERKSDSEIVEMVPNNNETESANTVKILEPQVETKVEEVPSVAIPIASKESKKRNKNNKSSKKKAQENESSPSTEPVEPTESESRVESSAVVLDISAEPRMSYSAALRLKESVQSPAPAVVSEPVSTKTMKSQKQTSQQSSKSSYNTKSTSKRLPHRTHSDSGRQQNSSRQARTMSQESSRNSPGEWETVPANIAAQPGEWERKEGKGRKKNKKIIFEDSVQEAELLDSELPSLEIVSQSSTLPPPTRQTRITPSPSPEKEVEPVKAPKPTIKQKPANKNKAKEAKSVKIVEKPATKEEATPVPLPEKEKSIEGEVEKSKKVKNKKKAGSNTNTQDTHTENTHRVVICDNQIEVRFSRCIRRASEVMDMERLEAVKRSGYCDVLLVEKLGSGIFRGSMHLGRLHQGKYVPPERSDAVLPLEPDQVQDQDQEEDQTDLEIAEENQDNTLPPLAEEIDLD